MKTILLACSLLLAALTVGILVVFWFQRDVAMAATNHPAPVEHAQEHLPTVVLPTVVVRPLPSGPESKSPDVENEPRS